MSDRAGTLNLYSQAADGSGTPDRLTTSNYRQWPSSITLDGTRLFGFAGRGPAGGSHSGSHGESRGRRSSGARQLDDRAPVPRSLAPRFPATAAISRTNRLKQAGARCYVRPFPQVNGGRWQISTRGGTRPAWSRDGRELFYIDESMALMRVPVQTSGPTLSYGSPTTVIDTKYAEPNPSRHYDVSPDGKRFLMLKASALSRTQHRPAWSWF